MIIGKMTRERLAALGKNPKGKKHTKGGRAGGKPGQFVVLRHKK